MTSFSLVIQTTYGGLALTVVPIDIVFKYRDGLSKVLEVSQLNGNGVDCSILGVLDPSETVSHVGLEYVASRLN